MTSRTDAHALLDGLIRRGVELRAEGDALLFRPASLLGTDDLEAMQRLKADLLDLLEPAPADLVLVLICDSLPLEDAQDLREERAAILEHLGGLSRTEAEHRAGLMPP